MNQQASPINLDDELLSAFLDAELSESDMERVRQAINDNEELANRIAELSMADTLVQQTFSEIDNKPVPEAITQLLTTEPNTATESDSSPEKPSDNVIQFPWWQRTGQKIKNGLQQNYGVAAAIALTLVITSPMFTSLVSDNPSQQWAEVNNILTHQQSGTEVTLDDGQIIQPQASFISKNNQFCRQFYRQQNASATENIACREDQQWQLVASVTVEKSLSGTQYNTASNDKALETTIDELIKGRFLNAAEESQAINNNWSTEHQ